MKDTTRLRQGSKGKEVTFMDKKQVIKKTHEKTLNFMDDQESKS